MHATATTDPMVGFLLGEPSADGGLKWYAVRVREGCEEATAAKCRAVIGPNVAEQCFVPKYEKYMKLEGTWRKVEEPMFRSYFFVASRDVRALAKALGRLSFPAFLAGASAGSYAALSPSVQLWLESALDQRHVLRASEGVIESGALRVTRGPLLGHERRIRNVNRRKRMAFVGLDEGGSEFLLKAALSVPEKS